MWRLRTSVKFSPPSADVRDRRHREGVGGWGIGKCLRGLVDLVSFELTTSSMPSTAPNAAPSDGPSKPRY